MIHGTIFLLPDWTEQVGFPSFQNRSLSSRGQAHLPSPSSGNDSSICAFTQIQAVAAKAVTTNPYLLRSLLRELKIGDLVQTILTLLIRSIRFFSDLSACWCKTLLFILGIITFSFDIDKITRISSVAKLWRVPLFQSKKFQRHLPFISMWIITKRKANKWWWSIIHL